MLRQERGLTRDDIARYVGISVTAVGNWERDETDLSAENLIKIAKLLRTSPDYILFGKNHVAESSATYRTDIQKVPLISSVQAGNWREAVDTFAPGDAEEWIETDAKVSPQAFALRVTGDSMLNPYGSPSIPEGAVVIVDPNIEATSGRIVVAKLTDSQEVTIKRLVIDGPNAMLMPLNPAYPAIHINGNCTIVGVARKLQFDL